MSRLIKALQKSQRQSTASAQDQSSTGSYLLSDEQDSQLLDSESADSKFIESGSLALDIDENAFGEVESDESQPGESCSDDFGLPGDGGPDLEAENTNDKNISDEIEDLYLDIAAQEQRSLNKHNPDPVEHYIEELLSEGGDEDRNITETGLDGALQAPPHKSIEAVEDADAQAASIVDQDEGLHSEEYSDTSQSIAVMFAEHGGREKNKNRWVYYSLAIVFSVLAFCLFTVDFFTVDTGGLSGAQQAAVYADLLSEEEELIDALGETDELAQSINNKQLQDTSVLAAELLEGRPVDAGALERADQLTPARVKNESAVSGIEFTRVRKAPQEITAINQAYRLYVDGKFEQALPLYQQALNEKPDSIDANLGLGAVLYELKDYVASQRYFERVLAMDASHVFAMSKKIEIARILSQESESTVLNESVFFGHQLPVSNEYVSDNAANYFYLGQAYAQRSQWSDAQQAFFQAHSMDKRNDLYIYNLAVALDQMQKTQLALPYYELVLQRKGVGDLDYQKIQQRVDSIIKNQ